MYMPDFGYKIKRFGWLKDYPSIKDYGPEEVERKLLSEIRLANKHPKDRISALLQTTTKTPKTRALPSRVDNRKFCSPVKDQGQLGKLHSKYGC